MDARTEDQKCAEATLPPELRRDFDLLVGDYQVLAIHHADHTEVNCWILADLIRSGWRKSQAGYGDCH